MRCDARARDRTYSVKVIRYKGLVGDEKEKGKFLEDGNLCYFVNRNCLNRKLDWELGKSAS